MRMHKDPRIREAHRLPPVHEKTFFYYQVPSLRYARLQVARPSLDAADHSSLLATCLTPGQDRWRYLELLSLPINDLTAAPMKCGSHPGPPRPRSIWKSLDQEGIAWFHAARGQPIPRQLFLPPGVSRRGFV